MKNPLPIRRDVLGLLLAGITFALYWPVHNYALSVFDDPFFTLNNPAVQSGLNWHSFVWAMTGTVVANWHPMTSLSFVLGHQFWGNRPGAEHLVNAALHSLNTALLFWVLQYMTKNRSNPGGSMPSPQNRSIWCSAVVAALFAWHPLRVESVAWIAERKDVLSVFFMLLTLLCYAKAVTHDKGHVARTGPGLSQVTYHSSRFYWLAVFFFALGLMSKAMLVTLPFMLLLLDFWPLKRVASDGWRVTSDKEKKPARSALKPSTLNSQLSKLFLEKWPFFALAAIFSIITFLVQRGASAAPSLGQLGLGLRLENVVVSYVRYLAWTVWPANLAVYYPFPKDDHSYLALWPGWEIAAGALLLAGISVLCLTQIARRPYLAVGWFWYLGTLVPVIGLVQIGGQVMADRYTYIPLIGPFMALVWLGSEKWPSRKIPGTLLTLLMAVILAGCIWQTHRQLHYWRNTVSLFSHAVDVTGSNSHAEYNLGLGWEHEGNIRQALIHYYIAMTSQPAIRAAFLSRGRLLEERGKWKEAGETYFAMLADYPEDHTGHLRLAIALSHLGRNAEAASQLKAAMQTCPDAPDALNNLAWTLATSSDAQLRDGAQAVRCAERANDLTHHQEIFLVGTLAAAYAEAGRFDEAVATAQQACALASNAGRLELLKRNQAALELYRSRRPYREPADSTTAEPITATPGNGTIEKLVPAAP